jgi:endonuclease G
MNQNDTVGRFRRYAEQIAPGGDLEMLISEQSPFESSASQVGAAVRALEKLRREEEPTLVEASAFEAIIRPRTRPIVDVIGGSYEKPAAPWTHYDEREIRQRFCAAIPAVGRIGVRPALGLAFAGTGFVVGRDLLMTNRHVAKLFSSGLGSRDLRFTREADVNFLHERDNPGSIVFDVVEIVMIHPWWDMALLRVAGLSDVAPLALSHRAPEDLHGHDIAVIGYPAKDPRNDVATQAQIFGGQFDIKRLQPGKLWERRTIRSFRNAVNAVTHDCSTLGGNSGSAVVLAASGEAAALHFAGRFRDANFAVPTFELARDSRVVDAGVNFTGSVPLTDEWNDAWRNAEAPRKAAVFRAADLPPVGEDDIAIAPATGTITTSTDGQSLTLTIPLSHEPVHITVSVGGVTTTVSRPGVQAVEGDTEAAQAIAPDPDWASRPGYKSDFLGFDHPVPVPYLSESLYADVALNSAGGDEPHLLKYHHFSICHSKSRCLPFFSAVNIEGTKEVDMPRGADRWFLDPRISRDYQLTTGAYTGTPFDRGHLVRRIDPVWGSAKEARLAHDDTFHWTNSSPQHAKFNRNRKTWGLIENHILKHTNKADRRASVFTGPVFADDDPIVVTPGDVHVQLPMQFWKVVVCVNDQDQPAASAFLISQEDIVNAWLEEQEFPVTDDVKPFQVSVAEIEQLTDLSFGELTQHDTMHAGTESTTSRHRIESLDDIVL